MPKIPMPRTPQPSDDVRGPNSPGTVDPGFSDPDRNPAGDTVGPGDFAGRQKSPGRDPYGYPIRR